MQHNENGVKRRRPRVQGGWASLPTQGLPESHINHQTIPEKQQDSSQHQVPQSLPIPPSGCQAACLVTTQGSRTTRLEASGPSQITMPSEVPRKFSWVEPGLLCALAFPDRAQQIQYLVENNVRCLVNLTQERAPPTHNFPDLKVIRIGIRDFTPPTLDQVKQFLDIVHKAKQDQKAVAVHCNMGKGRTGTLLACFIIAHHNMDAMHAIRHIKKLRPGSVQTAKQEECVHMFEEHFQRGMLTCDWT